MTTAEERRIVAEILAKKNNGEELTEREWTIISVSPYGTAASCRCKS